MVPQPIGRVSEQVAHRRGSMRGLLFHVRTRFPDRLPDRLPDPLRAPPAPLAALPRLPTLEA
ncbi:hypothetical protein GCM10023339_29490 [Alloalcanivorax gelatiniphagus]